jgi:exopolyphosphatase/guanosine-5'-triphosphate,3'-diphosphate pyrophosphatase
MDKSDRIRAVRQFADSFTTGKDHSEQVARLALQLFDSLRGPLRLNEDDRFLLECGAVLHDIGWVEGQQGHHKTSMRLILQDVSMPLEDAERKMIGLLVRYHRRALPSPDHPLYAELSEPERRRADLLAGLVRLADGLDRTHQCAVEQAEAEVTERVVTVRCRVRIPAGPEMSAAREKADLLERATGRRIEILCI